MKHHLPLTWLTLLSFIIITGTPALAVISRPGDHRMFTKVTVALFVLDIDEVITSSQSFNANVYLEARWHDDRLVHDGSEKVTMPLAQVWHPRVQFVNQQKLFTTFQENVEVTPGGEVTYRQRYWGTFSQPLNLHSFPFDRQHFTMQLVAVGYSPDEIRLIPDRSPTTGIADFFSVADWDILGWEIEENPVDLVPGQDPLIGLTFSINAKRRSRYFIVKVIIPLVLIVMMSWIVFWIDPKESGTQISVSITTMLTLIAYRFAVGTFLPAISYLTNLDYFIFASTFLVFASLVEVVITSTLAKSGRLERARSIDFWSRIVYPAFFIVLALESLVYRIVF